MTATGHTDRAAAKPHTKPSAKSAKDRHKAKQTEPTDKENVVGKQRQKGGKPAPKQCASAPAMRTINVADLFAAVPATSEARKRPKVRPVFTAGTAPSSPILQSPVTKKTGVTDVKAQIFGEKGSQRQRAQTTPMNKQRATPPHVGVRTRASNSGCFATPAYADSPQAAELPLPPIHWLLDTPMTTQAATTPSKPLVETVRA